MRFFDAGIEVAHDGSPVPSTVAASSPAPARLAMFSAGRLSFPANKPDNNDEDGGAPFGVTGNGEVCGLPRFSLGGVVPGGGHRPPSTPSEPWEENLPPDAHIDPYAPNRYAESCAAVTFRL